MNFRVGGTVWRGYRYWANDRDFMRGAKSGWNTCFAPYKILAITAQRIIVQHEGDSIAYRRKTQKDYAPLFLNRATMEAFGKQYHTRHHEYFYAIKPKVDPEHERQVRGWFSMPTQAMTALNLTPPYSKQDVRRAYKRLALTTHPDVGGDHEAFIRLKDAHDEALRYAHA